MRMVEEGFMVLSLAGSLRAITTQLIRRKDGDLKNSNPLALIGTSREDRGQKTLWMMKTREHLELLLRCSGLETSMVTSLLVNNRRNHCLPKQVPFQVFHKQLTYLEFVLTSVIRFTSSSRNIAAHQGYNRN